MTITADLLIRSMYSDKGVKSALADMKKVGSGAQAAGKGAEKGTKGFESLSGIVSGMAASGGLMLVAAGLRQVTEAAKEGAAIQQTEEAFRALTSEIVDSEMALIDMRNAVEGTISDTELMAGLNTVLAGTQGEVREGFIQNADALLQISKAASALNPQLGDTAFMYESISRGIKRASPMILDNLGIVVKVGDANERYAALLGKTVQELSAEEKQIALLNEVMQVGNTLVEDAANVNTDAADSIARMEAAAKNAGDEIKKKFAQPVSQAAEAAALLLSWNDRLAESLRQHANNMQSSKQSTEEYNAEIIRAADVAGEFDIGVQKLVEQFAAGEISLFRLVDMAKESNWTFSESENAFHKAAQGAVEFINEFKLLPPELVTAAGAASSFDLALLNTQVSLQNTSVASVHMAESLKSLEGLEGGMKSVFNGLAGSSRAATLAQIALTNALADTKFAMGLITEAERTSIKAGNEFTLNTLEIQDALARGDITVARAIEILSDYVITAEEIASLHKDEMTPELERLNERQQRNNELMNDAAEVYENFNPMIEGTAEKFGMLGEEMPVVAEGAQKVALQVSGAHSAAMKLDEGLGNAAGTMGAVEDAAAEALDDVDFLVGRLTGLPSSHTFTFNIRTSGKIPNLPSGAGSEAIALHHGGSFIVPPGNPNDGAIFRAESGERVTVERANGGRADMNEMNAGGGLTIEAGAIVINGAQDGQDVAQEVARELKRLASAGSNSAGRF